MAGVLLAHEGRADEECVDIGASHAGHVFARVDAALGHESRLRRNVRDEFQGGFEACLEGMQVAVVDAYEGRVDAEGAIEFGTVVDFHQGVHAEFRGEGMAVGEFGIAEGGGDEQHTICAEGAGLGDLPGVHDEVLAQGRQARCFAGGGQIAVVALKEAFVGEDR